MHWNYRAILHKHPGGDYYGLHEVFYDDAGTATGCTHDPVSFICNREEGRQALVHALERALADLKAHRTFVPPKAWDHEGNAPEPCPFCHGRE